MNLIRLTLRATDKEFHVAQAHVESLRPSYRKIETGSRSQLVDITLLVTTSGIEYEVKESLTQILEQMQ